ncbi:MAG: caspase family protein [Microcystaceae cyanobacterium]
MRFSALNALFLWLSVSVSVAAENSLTPTLYELDLDTPPQLSQELPLKQIIAQNIPKKALVIGNGAYSEARLKNPVNDANAVAKALQDLGFDVNAPTNLDLRQMDAEIERFAQELTEGGVGVFYYAGHGVQVNSENYLIPLDAELDYENDVKYDAVPLGKVINAMEAAKTKVNILIIDACRDNPFYRRWGSRSRGLTTVRGLEDVEATQGWVIAFATAPGDVAEDGWNSDHSPFTYHLLRHLKNPNQDVILMLRDVRNDVLAVTNNEQRPWVREFLTESFYFNPVAVNPTPRPQPLPSPSPQPTTARVTPPSPSPSPIKPPANNTPLISRATNVDYTPLRELLQAGKWKEADLLTWNLMLAAAKREDEGWLDRNSLENFACEDLAIMDQEWKDTSNGKFGFGIQKKLWQEVGSPKWNDPREAWRRLYIRLGWKTGTEYEWTGYVAYNNLTFNPQNAPEGHLPRAFLAIWEVWGGGVWGKIIGVFFSRTATCKLSESGFTGLKDFQD